MLTRHTKRHGYKMKVFNMFITAVCVIVLKHAMFSAQIVVTVL